MPLVNVASFGFFQQVVVQLCSHLKSVLAYMARISISVQILNCLFCCFGSFLHMRLELCFNLFTSQCVCCAGSLLFVVWGCSTHEQLGLNLRFVLIGTQIQGNPLSCSSLWDCPQTLRRTCAPFFRPLPQVLDFCHHFSCLCLHLLLVPPLGQRRQEKRGEGKKDIPWHSGPQWLPSWIYPLLGLPEELPSSCGLYLDLQISGAPFPNLLARKMEFLLEFQLHVKLLLQGSTAKGSPEDQGL